MALLKLWGLIWLVLAITIGTLALTSEWDARDADRAPVHIQFAKGA